MHRLHLLYILLTASYSVLGDFVRFPQDAVYPRGGAGPVMVECVVTMPLSSPLIWMGSFDGRTSALYVSQSGLLITNGDYSVSSTASTTGNYSLLINKLERQLSGLYSCQLGRDIRQAQITIADPPSQPIITVDKQSFVENQTATFTCKSSGGYPAPTFVWVRNGVTFEPTSSIQNNTGGVSSSVLQLSLAYTDHKTQLQCSARNALGSADGFYQLNVQFAPRLSIQPENLIVMKSAPFNLTCNVSSNPTWTSLRWQRNDNNVATQVITHSEVNGILADAAYRCLVSNTVGSNSATTQVMVQYAPVVRIEQPNGTFVDEGETLSLTCTVDAKPSATIRWIKDGIDIGHEATFTKSIVSKSDDGVYQCVASNQPTPGGIPRLESRSASIKVDVHYKPAKPSVKKISPATSSNVFNAGDSVQLLCDLNPADQGFPLASYRWYWQDQSHPVGVGKQITIVAGEVNQTGNYYCIAENLIGTQSSDPLQLSFQGIPQLISTIPLNGAINFTTDDQSPSIQCVYQGFPLPDISWYLDGRPIPKDNPRYSIAMTANPEFPFVSVISVLHFNNMQTQDMAKYTCEGRNLLGTAPTSAELTVNLLTAPVIQGVGKIGAEEGHSAELVCEVDSYPPVTSITILRNNRTILSTSGISIGDKFYKQRKTVFFTAVRREDFGSYKCICENVIGSTDRDIILQPKQVPDSPANLTYTAVTWQSAKLKWIVGFDGGYSQTFTIYKDGQPVKSDILGNTTEYELTDLMPSSTYTLTLIAHNVRGNSPPSLPAVLTTSSLFIAQPSITFDTDLKSLTVTVNASDLCIFVEGADSPTDSFKSIFPSCQVINMSLTYALPSPQLRYYRAQACLQARNEVCRSSEPVKRTSEDSLKVIVIAVVVSVGGLIIIAVIITTCICCVRRKKHMENNRKKTASLERHGHINPIMNSKDNIRVDNISVQHSVNNLNSDLDDPIDAYSNVKVYPSTEKRPTQNQNLDYVYGSVQKMSAEKINKMKTANNYMDMYELQNRIDNDHSPESNSDNTDGDQFDDIQSRPYSPAEIASIIGQPVPDYRRFPSLSESGYSTPDSKVLKKIIYEVIV